MYDEERVTIDVVRGPFRGLMKGMFMTCGCWVEIRVLSKQITRHPYLLPELKFLALTTYIYPILTGR